jgi:hypothetical protein
VLAGVLGLAPEVLGRLPVAEAAAPAAEERPSADAAEAPKTQRTTRQLRRARTPAGRADGRAQRRFIARRASDAPQMLPSGPTSWSWSFPFLDRVRRCSSQTGGSRKFCRNVREVTQTDIKLVDVRPGTRGRCGHCLVWISPVPRRGPIRAAEHADHRSSAVARRRCGAGTRRERFSPQDSFW